MKSIKAIFRRGQNSKFDGGGDNLSRTSSSTTLDSDQRSSKGTKPKKESRERAERFLESKEGDKRGSPKIEIEDVSYPSISSLQEDEFFQLRKQLQDMAQEKSTLAVQLGEQKGQLKQLQSEIQMLKSFQEESNLQLEHLTEENATLRNRLRDVVHSPLSDNEKQQLLFDTQRHHSSAPSSIATNLINDGNAGDNSPYSTQDWDKHSSSNVSEVSVACLQDKINQMQETHYSTNEELQATLQELTDLQRQLTELQQENERLNEEKALMFDSLCRQTERLNDSRTEVESLKQLLYREKEENEPFEPAAEREQTLVDLLKSVQEEREELLLKIEQISNDLQEARATVAAKDERILQLSERITTLECTLEVKQAEQKLLDQELTQTKHQSNNKQIEINRLTDMLENARAKISELEQDRALSDKSELDELLDIARKEKDSLESEITHFKEQLALSKNEIEKLKEQVQTLQEECKVTRNNARTTQSDLEYKCEKIQIEKNTLCSQLQEYQDAVKEFQVQSQCQLEDKRQLSAVLSESQRNLNEAERKNLELLADIEELRKLRTKENEEWEKFQNDLLTSVRVANDFKTEAQQELQRMILENKNFRDRERQLRAEIEKLKGNEKINQSSYKNRSKLMKGLSTTDINKENNNEVTKTRNRSNRRLKVLSTEEKTLLNCLNDCYEKIDKNVPLLQLTESEKAIITLKEVFSNENLRIKPIAPKPKHELEISKPLMKSVIKNSKLKDIIDNKNITAIQRPKRASSISKGNSIRSLKIENKDSLNSKDTMNVRRHSSGEILLKNETNFRSSTQLSEPGRKSSKFDLTSSSVKKQDQKKSKNLPPTVNVARKTERKSKLPKRRLKILSVEEEALIKCLNDCYSHIDENMPHSQLTESEKAIVALKEIFNNGEYKMKPVTSKPKDQLVISKPLLNSVLQNVKLKDTIKNPNIISTDIVNSQDEIVPVENYEMKSDELSFNLSNISPQMTKIPIRSYSDNDLFRKKNSAISPSLKASKHISSVSLATTKTEPKAYDDIQFTFDVMIEYSDKSNSSETFSSMEFNLDTGDIKPYVSESEKTDFMSSERDAIQDFDGMFTQNQDKTYKKDTEKISFKNVDVLVSGQTSEEDKVSESYENITNKLNIIKELISEDHHDSPYDTMVGISNHNFENIILNKDEEGKENIKQDVIFNQEQTVARQIVSENNKKSKSELHNTCPQFQKPISDKTPSNKKIMFANQESNVESFVLKKDKDGEQSAEQTGVECLILENNEKSELNNSLPQFQKPLIDKIPYKEVTNKESEIIFENNDLFDKIDGKSSIRKQSDNGKFVAVFGLSAKRETSDHKLKLQESASDNDQISPSMLNTESRTPTQQTQKVDITKRFYTNFANNSLYKSNESVHTSNDEEEWTFGALNSDDEEYNYKNILLENRFGVTSPLNIRSSYRDVVKEVKHKFKHRPMSLQHSIEKLEMNLAEIKKSKFNSMVNIDMNEIYNIEFLVNKKIENSKEYFGIDETESIVEETVTRPQYLLEIPHLNSLTLSNLDDPEDSIDIDSVEMINSEDMSEFGNQSHELSIQAMSNKYSATESDIIYECTSDHSKKEIFDDLFYIDTLTKLQKNRNDFINEEKQNNILSITTLDNKTDIASKISDIEPNTYVSDIKDKVTFQLEEKLGILENTNTNLQGENTGLIQTNIQFENKNEFSNEQHGDIVSYQLETKKRIKDTTNVSEGSNESEDLTVQFMPTVFSGDFQDHKETKYENSMLSPLANNNNLDQNKSYLLNTQDDINNFNESNLSCEGISTPILGETPNNQLLITADLQIDVSNENSGNITESFSEESPHANHKLPSITISSEYDQNIEIISSENHDNVILDLPENDTFISNSTVHDVSESQIYETHESDPPNVTLTLDECYQNTEVLTFEQKCSVLNIPENYDENIPDNIPEDQIFATHESDLYFKVTSTASNENNSVLNFPENSNLQNECENFVVETTDIILEDKTDEIDESDSYLKVMTIPNKHYQNADVTSENENYSVLEFPSNYSLQNDNDTVVTKNFDIVDFKDENYTSDLYFKVTSATTSGTYNQNADVMIYSDENYSALYFPESQNDNTDNVDLKDQNDGAHESDLYLKVTTSDYEQKIGVITYETENYSVLHFPENSNLQKLNDAILIKDITEDDLKNRNFPESDAYFNNKFSKIPKRVNQIQGSIVFNEHKIMKPGPKSSKDNYTLASNVTSVKSFDNNVLIRRREYSPGTITLENNTQRQSYPTIDKRLLTDMRKVKQFARHFERLSTDKVYKPKSPTQKIDPSIQFSKKKPIPFPRIKNQVGEKNDISDDNLTNLSHENCQDGNPSLQFQESTSKFPVTKIYKSQESLNVLNKIVDEKSVKSERKSMNLQNMFTVKSVLEIKPDDANSIHKAQAYSSVPMLGKTDSLNKFNSPISNNLKETSSLKLPSLEPVSFTSHYSDIPRRVENNAYEHLQERKPMFTDNRKEEDERPKIEFVPLDESTQPVFNKHLSPLDSQFAPSTSFLLDEKDMKPKSG